MLYFLTFVSLNANFCDVYSYNACTKSNKINIYDFYLYIFFTITLREKMNTCLHFNDFEFSRL